MVQSNEEARPFGRAFVVSIPSPIAGFLSSLFLPMCARLIVRRISDLSIGRSSGYALHSCLPLPLASP